MVLLGYFLVLLFCSGTFKSSSAFLSLLSGREGGDCDVDCEEEIPARPVCGSDGRTYDSTCEIERAKCQGHPVEFKHRGKCPEKARCEAQREALLQQANGQHQPGMFVPQCDSEGNYAQVQCYVSTGYCWCVDHSGKPIRGSSVQHARPNCQLTGRRSNRRRSSRGRKNKKACSSTDRASFNANLIDIFESEYNRLLHPPTTSAPSGPGTDPLTDTHEKAVIQWKFDQLDVNRDSYLKKREVRDLRRMAKKIVKPKVCAKTFAKYCDLDQDKKISKSEWSVCVGVDINNEQVNALDHILDDEPKEANSAVPSASSSQPSRPELWDKQQLPRLRHESRIAPAVDEELTEGDTREEEIQDCKTARRIATDSHRQDPAAGLYIPECTVDGLYVRAQCHKSTQYCWCVNPRTGKPIRGTATQGIKPDCDTARKGPKTIKGCSLHKKQEFLDELVQTFTKEMIEDARNRSNSGETLTPEKAARWKFSTIDTNSNMVLDKREWKAFKREWRLHRDGGGPRQRRRLRKCWRNLPRFCDENNNQKITVDEWLVCTGITRDSKGGLPRNHRRRGPNPFSTILKSD